VPAAVISMGILRALRSGNILQNNAVQTAAVSGEGLVSGVIFTLPALLILGVWTRFSYLEATLIAGFGGILGVLFTIPLRPADHRPGAAVPRGRRHRRGAQGRRRRGRWTARAHPLGGGRRGGEDRLHRAQALGRDRAVRRLGHRRNSARGGRDHPGRGGWRGRSQGRRAVLRRDQRVARAARGRLHHRVQRRHGDLCWLGVEPLDRDAAVRHVRRRDHDHGGQGPHIALAQALQNAGAIKAASLYHLAVTRYLGVGGMLVGCVWSLYKLRKSLLGGITAGLEAYRKRRTGGGGAVRRTEHDMPMNVILILIGTSVIPLFLIFWHFTGSW
jgi:hypothetical protein